MSQLEEPIHAHSDNVICYRCELNNMELKNKDYQKIINELFNYLDWRSSEIRGLLKVHKKQNDAPKLEHFLNGELKVVHEIYSLLSTEIKLSANSIEFKCGEK